MSTVKKNFAYQSVYQLLTLILPLITAPYIARVLGAENVGIYSYTLIVANYYVIFSMLGLEQYGNRSIAKVRDDEKEKNRIFSELFTLHLVIAFIVVVIYFIYVLFIIREYKTIFLLQGFYVCSSIFDVNWFFFGIEKFKVTVTRNIVIKLLSVVAMFIFVHSKEDLWIYTLIMSVNMLTNQVILWRFLPRYVSFQSVKAKSVISHLKPLLILFVAVIASNIYRMMDKLMLGWFDQMVDLGYYEYADKIIRIPLSLITALGTVMLPKMSNLFEKKDVRQTERMLNISALFVIFLSFALAFGIAGIAPEFVTIFLGDEYNEASFLICILAITIPLIGWNNFVRTQILIPTQKDKLYTVAVIIGAIVNLTLNSVLIYFYNARGAAISTIFSYTTVLLIQTLPLIKTTAITDYIKYVPYSLVSGIIMFTVVRIIGNNMGVSMFTVICEVSIGVIIYAFLSYIYIYKSRPDIYYDYIKRLKRK